MAEIPGGYIIIARKFFDSDVMGWPPLYLKLWIWMLGKANRNRKSKNLKIGQFFTTIAEMQEAMSWKVGYRKRKATIAEIRKSYEAFTKSTMISTTKSTRGMLITVLNYEYYQNPKHYEEHNEEHDEGYTKSTVVTHVIKQESKEIKQDNIYPSSFTSFWGFYPKKVGKGEALKAWKKIRNAADILPQILASIQKQKHTEQWTEKNGKYIPHPATWLNGRRWEDEVDVQPTIGNELTDLGEIL
jgi:hypothetical protein